MKKKTTIPSEVTPELFKKWRSPIRGSANPERMDNPVWEWLVATGITAYEANKLMKGPSSMEAGPCWCFDRFGQTRTELVDGRTVLIGGEHEDYYDADFYIYNDIVVKTPSGQTLIYGYPSDDFPPTDNHSATLLDDAILIIGNLSYPDDRRGGYTQVMRLDLETFTVSRIETSGDNPGWINGHKAELSEDRCWITVEGGFIDRCDGNWYVENIDSWRLNTETWCWERLSAKKWPRFEVRRKDNAANHLWELRQLLWSRDVGWHDLKEKTKELTESLGGPPRLDVIPTLYSPSLADEVIPEDDDEYGVYRIRVGDVMVRYVEDRFDVRVTVEGELSSEAVQELKSDLIYKLGLLEQAEITCQEIPLL